jgi:hypothetical protein
MLKYRQYVGMWYLNRWNRNGEEEPAEDAVHPMFL